MTDKYSTIYTRLMTRAQTAQDYFSSVSIAEQSSRSAMRAEDSYTSERFMTASHTH